MVPCRRQAAVCLSGREVDSQHAPPATPGGTVDRKQRWRIKQV